MDSKLRWSNQHDRSELEKQIAELTTRVLKLERQEIESPTRLLRRSSLKFRRKALNGLCLLPSLRQRRNLEFIMRLSRPTDQHRCLPGPPAGTTSSDRLRKLLGDCEWETLLARSLLNKIGALVLVIGIALFLGYSVKMVSPAGRAMTGCWSARECWLAA